MTDWFAEIYEQDFESAVSAARRVLPSEDEALDVAQTIFTRVWCQGSTVKRLYTPGYFARAARNEALNVRKRLRRRDAFRSVVRANNRRCKRPDDSLHAVEIDEAVAVALKRLPARCQIVARLRYESSMTVSEIGTQMGISDKAVEKQLARARRHLKALRKFVESDGGGLMASELLYGGRRPLCRQGRMSTHMQVCGCTAPPRVQSHETGTLDRTRYECAKDMTLLSTAWISFLAPNASSSRWLVLIALLGSACAPEDQSGAFTRDVHYNEAEMNSARTLEVDAGDQVCADNLPECQFTDLTIVAAAPTGSTLLGDAGGQLYQFDPAGRFVRPIGRIGEGPGEYRAVMDASVRESGEIDVVDIRRLDRKSVV